TTELYRYYETLLSGEILAPIETDWTYRNFVALEQDDIASVTENQFFENILEDAPDKQLFDIEAKGGVPNQQEYRVESFSALAPKLIALGKSLGYPIQSVLLTGHMKVMSLMSGEAHAVSSVTVNGRPEQEGAEQSLG
ncbi:hypothetical protein, partial [Pseudoalteromonas sp. P1-9]|uniref:hypothetical protein n=1 Tax=Pseudoalteromonas sp. P1-9 TaxID=1710354 RepID=UPI0013791783